MSNERQGPTPTSRHLLAGLRVKHRIYGGFCFVLLILAGIAGVGLNGLDRIAAGFEEYARVARNTELVMGIDAGYAHLRREARVFTTGDASAAPRVAAYGSKLRSTLADLQERLQDPQAQERARAMASLLDTYLGHFQKVQELTATRDQLISGTITANERRMTERLGQLIRSARARADLEIATSAGVAQEALQIGRVAVWMYLASGDPAAADGAREQLVRLGGELRSLQNQLTDPADQQQFQEVTAAVGPYTIGFKNIAALKAQIAELTDVTMVAIGGEFAAAAEAAVKAQSERRTRVDEETEAIENTTRTVSVAAAAVGLALGILLALLIARGILRPLDAITTAMTRLANGEHGIDIPGRERTDEIGTMAGAVDVFKRAMEEAEALRLAQEETKRRAEEERRAAMHALASGFENSVKGVVEAVAASAQQMRSSAEAMASTAEETSRQASAVAVASDQASANVQTVASASEELAGSISEIARQVEVSADIARRAMGEAARTNVTVTGLMSAAEKIGDVVRLISQIAGQTNLLALNATIEAARAGEAGKGFAVVAQEVKNLATQTAKATEDITGQVGAIQIATREAAGAIESIGGTIREMTDIATTIASAVEEQGAATREISRNVQEAAKGTAEASSSIAGVSGAAREAGKAADEVLQASEGLSQASERLAGEVDRFLVTVRAA